MKKPYIVLFILLGISLSINVLFIISDVLFEIRAKSFIYKDCHPSAIKTSDEDFRVELASRLKQNVISGRRIEFPSTKLFVSDRIAEVFTPPKKYPLLYWSEASWAFVALLEDAIIHNDSNSIVDLADVFCSVYNFPFSNVDQCTIGVGAILLDSLKRSEQYKIYADRLFLWLKDRDGDYGILYGYGSNVSIVDAIGMVVPFLMSYSKAYHNEEAEELAYKTIEKYIEFGCDGETGMPFFSYRLKSPHIKMGMSNWGRGVSWFCIGLLTVDETKLSAKSLEKVKTFNSTLCELWSQDHLFSQFVGEKNSKDLSAELPILYYLAMKKLVQLTKSDIIQYSKYLHDGEMYNSSSSNSGIIRYGVLHGSNMLSDAFMLKLINEVK